MHQLNEQEPWKSRFYSVNVLIALDELGNALFGGSPHETISARAWYARQRGDMWAQFAVPTIDWLFDHIGDHDHCQRVAANETADDLHPPHWGKIAVLAAGVGLLAMTVRTKKL